MGLVRLCAASEIFADDVETTRVLKKGLKSAQKALCCQGRVRRKQQEKDKVENVGFLIVTALFELT